MILGDYGMPTKFLVQGKVIFHHLWAYEPECFCPFEDRGEGGFDESSGNLLIEIDFVMRSKNLKIH